MTPGEWMALIGIGVTVAGAQMGWILSLHGRLSRMEARADNLESMRADMLKLMMHLVDEPRGGGK